MPPIDFAISIAMGVVTAFGASDMTTSRVAPKNSARITTETMPATHPASSDKSSGSNCFLMAFSCLYSGMPRATTAGLSQKSMYSPPA